MVTHSAKNTPTKDPVINPDSATVMMTKMTLAQMMNAARGCVYFKCLSGMVIGPMMFGDDVNLMSGINAYGS